MTESTQHVYLMMWGDDYEGGSTRSVHATEAGATIAAEAFMKEIPDSHWRYIDIDKAPDGQPFWREYHKAVHIDVETNEWIEGEEWTDTSNYVLIRKVELLP